MLPGAAASLLHAARAAQTLLLALLGTELLFDVPAKADGRSGAAVQVKVPAGQAMVSGCLGAPCLCKKESAGNFIVSFLPCT